MKTWPLHDLLFESIKIPFSRKARVPAFSGTVINFLQMMQYLWVRRVADTCMPNWIDFGLVTLLIDVSGGSYSGSTRILFVFEVVNSAFARDL